MTVSDQAPMNASTAARGPRRRARALAVLGGAIAALVVWLVAKYLLDVELRGPRPGDPAIVDIGPVDVLVSSVVWSLAGWGLLAVLERFLVRARTVWTWTAIVLFLLSFASPLLSANMTTGTRIALSIMHIAVAAVVIPVLARTSHRA